MRLVHTRFLARRRQHARTREAAAGAAAGAEAQVGTTPAGYVVARSSPEERLAAEEGHSSHAHVAASPAATAVGWSNSLVLGPHKPCSSQPPFPSRGRAS